MPHNGVSAFHYPVVAHYPEGSIWACTLSGGCDYEQHWTAALYGGYVQMPLNYLNQVETISFERIGTCKERPIGDQMRQLYRGVDRSYRFFVQGGGEKDKGNSKGLFIFISNDTFFNRKPFIHNIYSYRCLLFVDLRVCL